MKLTTQASNGWKSEQVFIQQSSEALWQCGTMAVAEVASGLVSYSIKFLFDWLPTLAEWALKSEP